MDEDSKSTNSTHSNTSSDSDNSSDDDNCEENTYDEEITNLEKQIETNPYQYQLHVDLIKYLQKSSALDKLRSARDRMSSLFPLSKDLWLNWLSDESKLVSTNEEKSNVVIQLFDRAIADYTSVEVWLEYVQFAIGCITMDKGVDKCRDVFERALTAVGLHPTRGYLIWEAYREFENVMMGIEQPAGGGNSQTDMDQQGAKIINLFMRQLSVPSSELEKTYAEMKEWTGDKVDQNLEQRYQKALAKYAKIAPFEQELEGSQTDDARLTAYKKYIEFESKEGEPARVQCLYERALTDHCLQTDLWKRYNEYLSTQLKIDSLVLICIERAVRNCPWDVDLWCEYIKSLERYNQPRDRIKGVFERSLAAGLSTVAQFQQLWLSYLEYLRRQTIWGDREAADVFRNECRRAQDYLVEYFGDEADSNLLQFWASVEAKHCSNMAKARELWTEILQQNQTRSSAVLLSYIQFERVYGDDKHSRKAFQRALNAVADWPEVIGQAWLEYERVNGNLDDFETASRKIAAKISLIQTKRDKEAIKEAEVQRVKSEREEQRKQVQKEKRSDKRREKKDMARQQYTNASAAKKAPVFVREGFEPVAGGSGCGGAGDFKTPPPPGWKGGAQKRHSGEESAEGSSETKRTKIDDGRAAVEHDGTKDYRTIFLSNLDYSTGDKEIRNLFEPVGEISEVRVVQDFKGRSKGYAYMEFKHSASVDKALAMDRTPIGVRPVFVSKSRDKKEGKKEPALKFATGLEKNKLFVKNLPIATTQVEVSDLFGQYGEVEVRLVTFRDGRSKGLAFVEYKDEVTAATALLKTDGTDVGGRLISVALSNPPSRKEGGSDVASLGGGAKDMGPRGRGRTQVMLLPRALQAKAAAPPANGTKDSVNGAEKTADSDRPKGNDYFRSLLNR